MPQPLVKNSRCCRHKHSSDWSAAWQLFHQAYETYKFNVSLVCRNAQFQHFILGLTSQQFLAFETHFLVCFQPKSHYPSGFPNPLIPLTCLVAFSAPLQWILAAMATQTKQFVLRAKIIITALFCVATHQPFPWEVWQASPQMRTLVLTSILWRCDWLLCHLQATISFVINRDG